MTTTALNDDTTHRLPLDGATRIVVCFNPLRIATESESDSAAPNATTSATAGAAGAASASVRFTIARFAGGVWRWRWDPTLYSGSLFVNGGTVVDGATFVDGDRVRYLTQYGAQAVDAVLELAPTSTVPCIVITRDRPFTPPTKWDATSTRAWSAGQALHAARVLGPWLTFVGPGARPRAIPVHGSVRRPLFIVPGVSVDEGLVVDDLPDQRVVIEHRGICSLAELVQLSVEQGAAMDPGVAVDLCLRAIARSARRFPLHGIEIDVDGAINVLHDFPSLHTAQEVGRVLSTLVCGRLDAGPQAAANALALPGKMQRFRRLLALAGDSSIRSFQQELAGLDIAPASSSAELGQVVAAHFPERVRAEGALEEELAALDQRGIDALVQRARDLQL